MEEISVKSADISPKHSPLDTETAVISKIKVTIDIDRFLISVEKFNHQI